jgi:hypothetical protein
VSQTVMCTSGSVMCTSGKWMHGVANSDVHHWECDVHQLKSVMCTSGKV